MAQITTSSRGTSVGAAAPMLDVSTELFKLLTSAEAAADDGSTPNFGPTEIEFEEVRIGDFLGKGASGEVFKATCRGKECAVKKFIRSDENLLADFRTETTILTKIRHENIVSLLGGVVQTGKVWLVIEYCERGALDLVLRNKDFRPILTLQKRMGFAQDIASGLQWLHASNPIIIHRDLKPANILLSQDWVCKISDFGLSCVRVRGFKVQEDSAGGTPLWMSPEVFVSGLIDEKSDIYSFSIIMWQIFEFGQNPFQEYKSVEALKEAVLGGARPQLSAECPASLVEPVQKGWDKNPAVRPKAEEWVHLLEGFAFSVIPEQSALFWWKKHFDTSKRVEWKRFLKAIHSLWPTIVSAPLEVGCLKAVVSVQAKGDSRCVTHESFGLMVHNFGPWNDQPEVLVNRLKAILQEKWYHGDIDSAEANAKLANTDKGYYLVRVSASQPGSFALSHNTKDKKIMHKRISFKPGVGYSAEEEGKTYVEKTLGELVKALKKPLGLSESVGGSKYSLLFQTKFEGTQHYH